MLSKKVNYLTAWRRMRWNWKERTSLKKWEAYELFLVGIKMQKKNKLNGFWENDVAKLALKQYGLYDFSLRRILFEEAYDFAEERRNKTL
ncbi:MAG: hypothetical protein ABIA78_04505 [archaeon]